MLGTGPPRPLNEGGETVLVDLALELEAEGMARLQRRAAGGDVTGVPVPIEVVDAAKHDHQVGLPVQVLLEIGRGDLDDAVEVHRRVDDLDLAAGEARIGGEHGLEIGRDRLCAADPPILLQPCPGQAGIEHRPAQQDDTQGAGRLLLGKRLDRAEAVALDLEARRRERRVVAHQPVGRPAIERQRVKRLAGIDVDQRLRGEFGDQRQHRQGGDYAAPAQAARGGELRSGHR
jgi:hypothetical protein